MSSPRLARIAALALLVPTLIAACGSPVAPTKAPMPVASTPVVETADPTTSAETSLPAESAPASVGDQAAGMTDALALAGGECVATSDTLLTCTITDGGVAYTAVATHDAAGVISRVDATAVTVDGSPIEPKTADAAGAFGFLLTTAAADDAAEVSMQIGNYLGVAGTTAKLPSGAVLHFLAAQDLPAETSFAVTFLPAK